MGNIEKTRKKTISICFSF